VATTWEVRQSKREKERNKQDRIEKRRQEKERAKE
jgi:hypothetical protein